MGLVLFCPLSAAAVLSSNKMLKQAFCSSSSTLQHVCHLYHLRWPFTFINKRRGYPPPNYILSHEGNTWQLSVIHVTPLLTCRKRAWIPTDKLLMIFSMSSAFCFRAQLSVTSDCTHWTEHSFCLKFDWISNLQLMRLFLVLPTLFLISIWLD